VFADDGTGIPFAPAQVEYGTEQLFNQITVTSPAGTATANGALSQTRYGILENSVSTLLSTLTQVEDYADFLVGRYDEPEYRFAQIAVDMSNLSSAQKASMFALDMASVIQIKFTPNDVGDPIERYGLVISIGHDISADEHIMNIGVGSLQTSLFVIGDSEFGTIGESAPGVLGF
jgi:NifB/MoaA-like Fe-S oxidoreductase